MSGSAPTPKIFGRPEAERMGNPRSQEQMQDAPKVFGREAPQWWLEKPKRVGMEVTTGQNLEGPTNAFDEPFWRRMAQQDRAQTTVAGRWKLPDATGVVTYDSDEEDVEFGDVFLDGDKVGNMYKGYGGMTETDSDQIMARLVLDPKVIAKAHERDAGRPGTLSAGLSAEIQAERKRLSENRAKGLSSAAFEQGLTERAAQMQESEGLQAANVAAGAAGGAITGAGVGTLIAPGIGTAIGAGLGGLIGGFGSWFNRDEAFRNTAMALEQFEMAAADGHQQIGYADAALGLMGVVAEKLSPTRNLLHGWYDGLEGEQGDNVSSFRRSQIPGWMQALDMTSLVVDGFGTFGSSLGRQVYVGVMGATTATNQAGVAFSAAEDNLSFNPYTGEYENIGAAGMWQRQASVGIDLAQTAAAGWTQRLLGRKDVSSQGGWRIRTTASGERATAGLGFSVLVPSEAVTAIGARALARRSINKMGLANTAENRAIQTARHIENLTTGRRGIATIALNGFGEGTEEVVQAVLGATAFGETPTFREITEAAKQGFGMGAGMGAAVAGGYRNRSQTYMTRANLMRGVRGEQPFDEKTWGDLTEADQVLAGTASTKEEQRIFDLTVERSNAEGLRITTANMPEIQKVIEIARQTALQESRNADELVESSLLQTRSNHDYGPQDYVVSLVAAQRMVEARQAKMAESVKNPSLSDEEKQQVGAIAATDAVLLAELKDAGNQIDAGRDPAVVLAGVNKAIQRRWRSTSGDAFGERRSSSVWGARFPLNSAGSFQLLRLQVDPQLTMSGANNVALVPDEILTPTGGDFDGDRFINMMRELLSETSYNLQRWGAGQLTRNGTMLKAKPYLEGQSHLLFAARRAAPNTLEYQHAKLATANIRNRLVNDMLQAGIDKPAAQKMANVLVRGLSDRNVKAMGVFFDELATRYAGQMREYAQRIDDSPWLKFNRIIEDEMRMFADRVAVTQSHTNRTGVVVRPTTKNTPRWRSRVVRAPSAIAEGLTALGKFEAFRLQTVLKYNARREATTTTPEEEASEVAELIRTFTARNDGLVRPGEQELFRGQMAQIRTTNWLRQVAVQYQEELGTTTIEEAMVLLAGANVQDINLATSGVGERDNVKLVQLMLREVVGDLRKEYAEILVRDETVATQLGSLEALTRPIFRDGAHTHSQGGDAFVEVLGDTPLWELLGEHAGVIGHLTARQLRRTLINMRYDARQEFEDDLTKGHPSWHKEDGVTTPYRVLIENVIESARMQLTENRDTHLPSGALTRASSTAKQNFKDTHDNVRAIANARKQKLETPQDVRELLEGDVRLAKLVFGLLEARGVRAGVVQRNTEQEIVSIDFSQMAWIYDVFAEPSTALAEMMLLRETLRLAKVATLSYDDRTKQQRKDELESLQSNDRIVRLWLDLDFKAQTMGPQVVAARMARERFLDIYSTSRSTDSFIAALNEDSRFRDEFSPPFMAWNRDLSVVEDSRFGSGVSDVQEGVGMREALRDAARGSAGVLADAKAATYDEKLTAELVSQLRISRDAPVGSNGSIAWRRFISWFELSKTLPPLVGISVTLNQLGHINEIMRQMGVKGVSPGNVESMGEVLAAQLTSYNSAPMRLVNSLLVGTEAGVITDPQQLTRGNAQIMLSDGTLVNWEQVTPEAALELLTNPDTAGFATRMMGLTAWDYNEESDQNSLVTPTGRGVLGFATDPTEALFSRNTESQFLRLMVIEGMASGAGEKPILPVFASVLMNLREAASDHVISDATGERKMMAVDLLKDIAEVYDVLSRVHNLEVPDGSGMHTLVTDEKSGQRVSVLNQILLNAARRYQRARGTGNLIARLLPEDPMVREATEEALSAWVTSLGVKAVQSKDDNLLAIAKALGRMVTESDNPVSPLDLVLSRYENFMDPQVQLLLVDRLRSSGDILTVAPWARKEMLAALDTTGPRINHGEHSLPNLEPGTWEMVARAVIGFTMHTEYGMASRSEQQISVFPQLADREALDAQRSFWDATHTEAYIDLLAPGLLRNHTATPSPLLQANLDLKRKMAPQLSEVGPEEAEDAVFNFMNKTRNAEWHSLLPAMMSSAQGAVLASPASPAVSMAGLTPGSMAWLSAATRQDWSQRPPDSELSHVKVNAARLVTIGDEFNEQIEMSIFGGPTSTLKPIVHLEGRVMRSFGFTVNGKRVSLLGHTRFGSGVLLPPDVNVPAGEGGVLNLRTMQQILTSALRDAGVAPENFGDVDVDIAFFHPDSKTVSSLRTKGQQFDHNPWFDGVGGATDAGLARPSLIGGFLFGLDGVIPAAYERALSAIKYLTFALQEVNTLPEQARRVYSDLGKTNMSAMLDQLTEFTLKQPIDGDTLDITDYNAVRKLISLAYVVRYYDQDGGHVLSSEEVIARQMRGETLPATSEVVGLPMQHLITLTGDQSSQQGFVTPFGDRTFSPDTARAPIFDRFPAHAWTDQMYGGFTRVERDSNGNVTGFATADLMEQPFIQNQSLPKARVRSYTPPTPAERGDYYGPYQKIQERIYEDREKLGASRWAEQRKAVWQSFANRDANIAQRVIQAVNNTLEGRVGAAARLHTPITDMDAVSSTELSTAWRYVHRGAREALQMVGILTRIEQIREQAAPNDQVIVDPAEFLLRGEPNHDAALAEAVPVLRALMDQGATILLPEMPAGGVLRRDMAAYLRENNYAETDRFSGEFVPQAATVGSQQRAAFASRLNRVVRRTSRNRALLDLSLWNNQNENSIYNVNGGIGGLETLDLHEVVQTGRYASYGLPLTPGKKYRQRVISELLPLLRSDEALAYLREQSGIEEGNSEELADFERAIKLLHDRLVEAQSNPGHSLVPTRGDDFGTGDFIPLVQHDGKGNLVGIHLYRHGHKSVNERALRGALPKGNDTIGTDIRLTVDRARVDSNHTTHRGEIVDFEWHGVQGFTIRLRTPLASFGAKVFEALTGMKWTTAPPPSDLYIPTLIMGAGAPVLGAADIDSPLAKTSDGGWLNTPGRIAEYAGYSVMPHIVRALTGVDIEAGNDQAYDEAEQKVYRLLNRYQRVASGTVNAEDLVRRKSDELGELLNQRISAEIDARLDEVDGGIRAALLDTSTDQKLADSTLTSFVLQALAAGAELDTVLGAPGYIGEPAGTESFDMHPVFTTQLHQLPDMHPARIAFVDQINARMPRDPRNGDGYTLLPNFTWLREVTLPDNTTRSVPAMLAFPEIRATDTNDTLSEMAQSRRQRGDISSTTLGMAFATHGAKALINALTRASSVFEPNKYLHTGTTGLKQLFFNTGMKATPFVSRWNKDLVLIAAEGRHIFNLALPRRKQLSVPIDTSAWYADVSSEKRRQMEGDWNRAVRDTLERMGFDQDRDMRFLTEMIRSVAVRPGVEEGQPELLKYHEAMSSLKLIQRNIRNKDLPTHGGGIGIISEQALARLYEVQYQLRDRTNRRRPVGRDWNKWVAVVIGEAFSPELSLRGYPAVSNIIDGMLYEYRKDVAGLPASIQSELASTFNMARTNSGLFVASPHLRNAFDHPSAQDGELIFDVKELSSADYEVDELPQEARAIVDARMTRWEAERGMTRVRQSPKREAMKSARVVDDIAHTNVLMRFLQLNVVAKAMANVGLWISAFLELGIRGQQEWVVSFLAGETNGVIGRQFTSQQRDQWKGAVEALAHDPRFYSMLYRETNYTNGLIGQGGGVSKFERAMESATTFIAAAHNDPIWGQRARTLAREYLSASWESVDKITDTRKVSLEMFLDTVSQNPESLQTISVDAHKHGLARLEYRRGLQDNLLDRTRRSFVEGAIRRGGTGGNTLGTLFLRFPSLFFRYRSNMILNMTGMQGVHAAIASILSDRTKRAGGLSDRDSISDQARIEDSYDLTRAFLRSGVSHTQLMMLGMMIGSLDLAGDDEDEEYVLDKIRRYQKPVIPGDPLSEETDWRNADAWYSELLPAGMGVPSWIIKPFVSPAMGIARFAQDGDFRQVLWGFMDALGSMPLLNTDHVLKTWDSALEIAQLADEAAAEDGEEAAAKASNHLFLTMATLESLLFESAFFSMIYQASDEWDRDPYAIPMTDSAGVIQRFGGLATGVPRPTDALQDIPASAGIDQEQGYTGRPQWDARLRALAENRPMLAIVLSLIKNDSTYLRYNMVGKVRDVDAAPITQEEGEQIILSVLDNENRETLTAAGGAGIIRGINLGTVRLDSPALQGVYLDDATKNQIQLDMLEELTAKYLERGFPSAKALSEAKAEWYGQRFGEPEALGMSDILWNHIPNRPTTSYLQMNTTYVMGPNKQPVATGLSRSVLDAVGLNIQGLGVFQTYEPGAQGGGASNMDTDALLNSVDSGRGINLGMRSLVKIDDTWKTPTAAEIGESIEAAIEEIGKKIENLGDTLDGSFGSGSGWRNFGRGGGGGGGGFGTDFGGQVVRMNTPRGFQEPFALSPRVVNTSNPIIRRASVRRERFSADRGRLFQWQ